MPIAPLLVGTGLTLAGDLLRNRGDAGSGYQGDALRAFDELNPPTAEELQYQVEQLVQQGVIAPEMADAVMQQPSLLNDIVGNAQAKNAQMTALSKLQDIGNQGGMTVSDKATLSEINAENAAKERGAREALAMNARERGVGGSGIDLVSQMIAQQESAGRASQAGLDVAKQAQQRALDAIAKSGELGTKIESQDFGEQAAKAEAQDAINKFNTANRQDVVNANIAAKNTAQATNLAERQRVADTNVGIINDKAKADAEAKQTAYQDQFQKAAGKSGQLEKMADSARKNQQTNDAALGNTLGTIGNLVARTDFSKKKKEGLSEY